MTYDLIVVSSYPRTGTLRDKFTVGVADYTKQTLISFPPHLNILVLAENLPGEPEASLEKNITIHRLWQRNSPLSFFRIFQEIKKYPKTPLLFEFEMAMYGSPLMNLFFVKLLFILRILKRKSYVVLHQVVTDFNEISGHIGQSPNSPFNHLLNLSARIFYYLVVWFSTKTIVFEQFLKNRLNKDDQKIVVIPHGVPQIPIHKSNFINHKSFTITVFGYLAWYKGTDWVVKVFSHYFDKHPNSKFKLIIAGGPNPNHLNKPYYQQYLKYINDLAQKHPQKITITGFVPETEITKHYQQSDLIILPYRVGMSSSGPLSLAFAYGKPVLVSQKISPIFDTLDINHILPKKVVEFDLEPQKLLKKIISFQKSPQSLNKLSRSSQQIASIRSWSHISQQYLKCLEF